MTLIFRTATLLLVLLFCDSCQKQIRTTTPTDTQPTDSTGAVVDSTINHTDSLAIFSFSPDSGVIGTEIRILGSGFDTTASKNVVWVNATPAMVLNATKTMLSVQVLEGSTTGHITVIANGDTAFSTTNFQVVADSISPGPIHNTGTWVRKADRPVQPEPFSTDAAFAIDDLGYLLIRNALWSYNPATDNWRQEMGIPSLPYNKEFRFSFIINHIAYVGLGASLPGELFLDLSKNYNEVWAYDAQTKLWTRKKDFPGAPRVAAFGFALNGVGYMGGGDTSNANLSQANDFWKYDPVTDEWTRLANVPFEHTIGISGVNIGNKAYVLEAGAGNPTAPVLARDNVALWEYDSQKDKWIGKASFAAVDMPVVSATLFELAGSIYVAFGRFDKNGTGNSVKEDFWAWNPQTNKWNKKADVGGGIRWFGVGFSVKGKGYIGGGTMAAYGSTKQDFWAYTPE